MQRLDVTFPNRSLWKFSFSSPAWSKLTSTLEQDHDVCSPTIDLLEVKWDDIAVELEGLSNGGVHLPLWQIWGVSGDPDGIKYFVL